MTSALTLFIATGERTSVMRSARPVSYAVIITLRTNGELGPQCSFMVAAT